jgi:hypothetical protein
MSTSTNKLLMPPDLKAGKCYTPYAYFSLSKTKNKKQRPPASFIFDMFVSFNQQQLIKGTCTDHSLQGRGCNCNCLSIFGYTTVFQHAVESFR